MATGFSHKRRELRTDKSRITNRWTLPKVSSSRKGDEMRFFVLIFLIAISLLLLLPNVADAQAQNHVTILYDAFGQPSLLRRDWGFAALIEYGGKRILFDTGNNADTFAHNVKALKIDLKRLDFVVISHRHCDHTSGLNYLLSVNPRVKIFAPKEGFGVFGASLPGTFYRQDSSLPDSMRYFKGTTPERLTFGTPWPAANF